MAFEWKDNFEYDELRDVTVAAAVAKGEAIQEQDVFGFFVYAVTAQNILDSRDEVTIIYKCRQVNADKLTGTGEAISAGERLYYIVASDAVSKTPTGTPGTDSYFCGWAKRNATAEATTVLMNFDGTRWDETI